MKITIVLGPFQPLPPAGMGAVEKVWYELAQEFALAGHEVLLVGKGVPGGAASRDPTAVRFQEMRGYTASAFMWLNLVKDFLYSLEVRRGLGPADIVVTKSFWMPVVLGLLRGDAGNIVVHVARFPKGQMRLYRRVQVLQAISSAVAAEIVREAPFLRDKVRVLPYPIDLDVYCPPAVARRYDGDLTILYVGRVHPEKGLQVLIEAFRRVVAVVPKVRLRIVGPASVEQGGGGPAWFESLKKSADGLPVEFAGPIADRAALALELQHAHCFCYPSLAEKGEAFGLAVLEAMATGLPVVVSELACFNDFLESGRDGLAFDHRVGDRTSRLAARLVEILSDQNLARRLGENAATKAREFELDGIAARYIRLFEETARGY